MTDLPIIMSPAMVAAIMREIEHPGTGKTMTRRLPTPTWRKLQPGDRLYVRETHWRLGEWKTLARLGKKPIWEFCASNEKPSGISFTSLESDYPIRDSDRGTKRTTECVKFWKRPSIFHPKHLSRITLLVEAVKTERLQEISAEDAMCEGVENSITGWFGVRGASGGWIGNNFATAPEAFSYLWMSLHGANSWTANPEVVAVSFKPVLQNIETLPKAA